MLEAIKLTKTIESSTLTIQELEQFQGLTVDIIILAAQPPAMSRKKPRPHRKTAGGMLAKYANPALWEQESTAWERVIEEKYAHR